MVKELIPRPLPAKARLHLAHEENASLRTRIAALEAQLAEKDKEIAVLREALVQIDALDPEGHAAGFSVYALRGVVERMGTIARAALAQGAER